MLSKDDIQLVRRLSLRLVESVCPHEKKYFSVIFNALEPALINMVGRPLGDGNAEYLNVPDLGFAADAKGKPQLVTPVIIQLMLEVFTTLCSLPPAEAKTHLPFIVDACSKPLMKTGKIDAVVRGHIIEVLKREMTLLSSSIKENQNKVNSFKTPRFFVHLRKLNRGHDGYEEMHDYFSEDDISHFNRSDFTIWIDERSNDFTINKQNVERKLDNPYLLLAALLKREERRCCFDDIITLLWKDDDPSMLRRRIDRLVQLMNNKTIGFMRSSVKDKKYISIVTCPSYCYVIKPADSAHSM